MKSGKTRSGAMGNTTPLRICVAGAEKGAGNARATDNSTRPELQGKPYIAPRFANAVNTHLIGNRLDIEGFPVIMWIVGRPGMGKTWQLRRQLEELGHRVFSVDAAELESVDAGEPAKLVRDWYLQASKSISAGGLAAFVIDDIDTTLGEWEGNTGTVNHQDVLAFFMHIADRPDQIDELRGLARVPIFFTGNDITKLYAPLKRSGRTNVFAWEPTFEEKAAAVLSILHLQRGCEGIARAVVGETQTSRFRSSRNSRLWRWSTWCHQA